MFAITVQNRGRLENNRALIGFFNEQTKEINFVKEDALPDTLTNTNFCLNFGFEKNQIILTTSQICT